MRLFLCVLSIFALTLSCTKDPHKATKNSAPKATIRLALNENFTTCDPRRARSICTINLIKNTFEGLTRYTIDGKIEYALADDIIISPDGKTYTITLRPAKWSDGKELTAHDFEFSWKSSLNPATRAPNAYQLFVIKNAKSAYEGKCHPDTIGIVAIDNRTLEITLENPTAHFLELLAFHPFFPVAKHYFEDSPLFEEANPKEMPVNGPFMIKEWHPNLEFSVIKNPNYREALSVTLDQVVYTFLDDSTALQMFEKGELDWTGAPTANIPIDAIQTLRKEKKLQSSQVAITQFIRCNTANPYLNNVKLRKALSLAFDRRGITDHALQSGFQPATSFVPPSAGLLNNSYFPERDTAQAKKLYQEAMEELKITRPSLSLIYTSSEESNKVAQVLQQSIKEALNCDITLEPLEAKMFFERLSKHNYTLAFGRWSADFYDPISFLSIFESKNNGTNNTDWENSSYTALLQEANHITNTTERKECLEKAQKILMNDLPIIPLFFRTSNYLQGARIKNISVQPLGIVEFRHVKLVE